MKDEITNNAKDFRYYADKAEKLLAKAESVDTMAGMDWRLNVADRYIQLARYAPETAPPEELHYYINGMKLMGRRCGATLDYRQCVLGEGHDDKHLAEGGGRFDD